MHKYFEKSALEVLLFGELFISKCIMKWLFPEIINIIIISILLGQRPDKNEIITERHSNGLKKLVLIFEGEGLNEILIGKYGFYENGLKRIVRCHPIKILGGSEGFDPVNKKKN